MQGKIEFLMNTKVGGDLPDFLKEENLLEVRNFHKSLDNYAPTPLVSLPCLAEKLGVGAIYIKDESKRFGLNAFKGLGASYAVAKATQEELLKGKSEKDLVFVTATDGNHGRAVAWSAAKMGAKCFVFMPKGSAEVRAEAIRGFGDTKCEITNMNYDDTVRYATRFANEHGYILVQDTGFEGYEDIPNYITQGYTTMVFEALNQMQIASQNTGCATHVFLQAGVGSLAGGVLGYLACESHGTPPATTIVEPTSAACVFESAKAGQAVAVGGEPTTQMAGLNCGEPNIYTWPILRDFATAYAKCPDWVTEIGMRTLAHPLGTDECITSGESGAVGLGTLIALCTMPEYRDQAQKLGLSRDSIILLFSTEGDTDPENYQRIISSTSI